MPGSMGSDSGAISSRHASSTWAKSGKCSARLSTIHEQISSALRIVSSAERPVYGVSCQFDRPAVQRFRQLREAWQLKQRMPRQVVAEQEGPAVEVAAEGVRIDFETSAGSVHGIHVPTSDGMSSEPRRSSRRFVQRNSLSPEITASPSGPPAMARL